MQIYLLFSKHLPSFHKSWKLALFIGIILFLLVHYSSSYEVSLNLGFLKGRFFKESDIPSSLNLIIRPAESLR